MANFVDEAFEIFEEFMTVRGCKLEEFSHDNKYTKAIFLKKLFKENSEKFVEKLDKETKQAIGIQQNIHNSTISRREKELKQNEPEEYHLLEEAAERTVYALLAGSSEVPAFIFANWDLDPKPADELSFDRTQEQAALRNWVPKLIDVLSPLKLYYDDNLNILAQHVGLCAHSALQSAAPSHAINSADWVAPRDNIPRGPEFFKRIRNSRKHNKGYHKYYPEDLVNRFYDCFSNFVNLSKSIGFFNSKSLVALDTTHVPVPTAVNEGQMVGGGGPGAEDGENKWLYQVTCSTKNPSKFILSVEPIYNKKNKHIRLKNQLIQLSNLDINVDLIMGDSGYYSKKAIRKLRHGMDDRWVVHAEVRGESDISKLVDRVKETGKPEPGIGIEISTPSLKNRPNGFAYPNTQFDPTDASTQQTVLTDCGGDTELERFYDTDPDSDVMQYVMDKYPTDRVMRKVHVCYRTRDRIEPKFGQIKHFHLPYTESTDEAVRYYIFSMACMFHNFHYMINRSTSYRYCIPLQVSIREWLSAIRDVTFSD